MKIRIQKEADDMFFAKIIGIQGVYAQGETLHEAIENLIDVYKQVIEFKQQKFKRSSVFDDLVKQQNVISTLPFTQLDFVL